MDYYSEYSNTNSINHTSKFYYVIKKLTQIILSFSLFSFLISQYSLAPILVNSYDYFVIPKISIKLFTYTTERNCIFLLCNGILVLIIQTSGLISKITPVQSSTKVTRIVDHRAEKIENGPEFQENNSKNVRKANVIEEKERETSVASDIKEDYESVGINIQEWDYYDDDQEEEVIDELHKKCEDFIKKVKQEIQGSSK